MKITHPRDPEGSTVLGVAKIHTDEGDVRVTERAVPRESSGAVIRAEVERLSEVLIGADPMRVESLWDDMAQQHLVLQRRAGHDEARSAASTGALGPQGQGAGPAVYELLGGKVAPTPARRTSTAESLRSSSQAAPGQRPVPRSCPDRRCPGEAFEVDDWRPCCAQVVSGTGLPIPETALQDRRQARSVGRRYRNRVVEIIEGA